MEEGELLVGPASSHSLHGRQLFFRNSCEFITSKYLALGANNIKNTLKGLTYLI